MKEKVIAYLIRIGWSEVNALSFCEDYYDIAVSKGIKGIKKMAEFVSWESIWRGVTGQ